jgi:hypothetical protein
VTGVLFGLWHFTLYGVIPAVTLGLLMWLLSVLPVTCQLMRDIGRAHLNLWVEPLLRAIAGRPRVIMTPEDRRAAAQFLAEVSAND